MLACRKMDRSLWITDYPPPSFHLVLRPTSFRRPQTRPLPPLPHGSSFLFLLHLSSEAPLHLRNLRERRERERPPFESCQRRQFATCLRSCLPLLSLLSVGEESASTTAESAAILAGLSAIGRDLDDRWRPGINQRDEVERDKLNVACNRRNSMNIFFFRIVVLNEASGKFFYILTKYYLRFCRFTLHSLFIFRNVVTLFWNWRELKSFFFIILLYPSCLNKYL